MDNPHTTIFHELLNLINKFISHDLRVEFYTEALTIIGVNRIKLDFLLGHDKHFDEAHKKATDKSD